MQSLTLSAILNAEDDGYVALCPELDIASQGDSIEQALENLKEAVEGVPKQHTAKRGRFEMRPYLLRPTNCRPSNWESPRTTSKPTDNR